MIRSARDIADGGIAVALAQAAFPLGIGATVEQEPSLMAHPLFGLFAEPASTVLSTADPSRVAAIEEAGRANTAFLPRASAPRAATAWKSRSTASRLISASLDSLRRPWASALEATLHDEVTA